MICKIIQHAKSQCPNINNWCWPQGSKPLFAFTKQIMLWTIYSLLLSYAIWWPFWIHKFKYIYHKKMISCWEVELFDCLKSLLLWLWHMQWKLNVFRTNMLIFPVYSQYQFSLLGERWCVFYEFKVIWRLSSVCYIQYYKHTEKTYSAYHCFMT